MNQSTKPDQNESKVGRAISKWGVIEKSPILLSQYWKINIFMMNQKNILSFGRTNTFFANCINESPTFLEFNSKIKLGDQLI